MSLRLRALLVVLGLAACPACGRACDTPGSAGESEPGPAAVEPLGPPPPAQLPTTALAPGRTGREKRADLGNLGTEASLLGQLGRAEEAKALFLRAPSDYRSVSAFPVAWLFLQEGRFWERAGEAARARAYYQAAYERL